MTITAPPFNTRARRGPAGDTKRLVAAHERLQTLLVARRANGLTVDDLWNAMVQVEDELGAVSPRAHGHWIAVWAMQTPVTTDLLSGPDPHSTLAYSDRTPASGPQVDR